jgi:hypothetical protein
MELHNTVSVLYLQHLLSKNKKKEETKHTHDKNQAGFPAMQKAS